MCSLSPGLPEVQEALQWFYKAGSFDVVEKGWASNKHKICHLLKAKKCQYLLEKYNRGIVYHQKFNAEVVDEEMRRNPSFVRSDFLTPQQITLFWAREASRRGEEPTTFYSRNLNRECGVEDEEEPYKDSVMSHPHLEYETLLHPEEETVAANNFGQEISMHHEHSSKKVKPPPYPTGPSKSDTKPS
uniref:Uncharacterized protein n=1 Tax=Romanomermis culicivorax TaxID=13658 RepID=A0A915J815_ROMCU